MRFSAISQRCWIIPTGPLAAGNAHRAPPHLVERLLGTPSNKVVYACETKRFKVRRLIVVDTQVPKVG